MLTQVSSLQSAIDSIEALSEDEQDLIFDLIQKRRIALRRKDIAQSALDTMVSVENSTAKRGTATEIMADIFGDDE